MTRFQVVLTKQAERQIERIDTWWGQNRLGAPGRVGQELSEAIERLEIAPKVGSRYAPVRNREVRRILMRDVSCHLYYTVDTRSRIVRVEAIWHAARGSGPKL